VRPPRRGQVHTLKLIAGIEEVSAGEILLGDTTVTRLPPERRDVAMAFESYALYPHWTVRQNLEFPLRAPGRRLSAQERRERIERVAALLEIGHLLNRHPNQLSGGQRQRVSLGRALVRRCNVALLDEPIAHLDARLRFDLRGELKRFQRENGVTTLYATPDFAEAASISDRIAVLIEGELRQVATPAEVFDAPADTGVALLAGDPKMNLFPVERGADGAPLAVVGTTRVALRGLPDEVATVGVRPTYVELLQREQGGAIPGSVYVAEPMGEGQVVRVDVGTGVVNVRLGEVGAWALGQPVWLRPDWAAAHRFDRSGRRLQS
jgi:multiple sugar transport system ATP-binding protein